MKKSLLALFVALFLSACSDNSLEFNSHDSLILNENSKSLTLSETILDLQATRFYTLDVLRVKVANSLGKPLFYERVSMHNDYELRYRALETLKRVFKLSSANVLYESDSLLFVQLEEQNRYINLIAQKSSLKSLDYVYGFSNKEFFILAKELGLSISGLKVKNEQEIDEFKSYWLQNELILSPLSDSKVGWSI